MYSASPTEQKFNRHGRTIIHNREVKNVSSLIGIIVLLKYILGKTYSLRTTQWPLS